MKKFIVVLLIGLMTTINIACAQEEKYDEAYQKQAKEYIMENMKPVSNNSVQILMYVVKDDYTGFRSMLMENKVLHINDIFTHNEEDIKKAYNGLRKVIIDNKITNLQLADEFNNYKSFGLFGLDGSYQDLPMLYDIDTNQYVDVVSYLYITNNGIKYSGLKIDQIIKGSTLEEVAKKNNDIIQAFKNNDYDEFCRLVNSNIYIIVRFPQTYFNQISKLLNDDQFITQKLNSSRSIHSKINMYNYFYPPKVDKTKWKRPSNINIDFDNEGNVASIQEDFMSMDYNVKLDAEVDKFLSSKYKDKYVKSQYMYMIDDLLENVCSKVYFIDKGVNFYRSRSYIYKVTFNDGTNSEFIVFVDKFDIFHPKLVYISQYNSNLTGDDDFKNWLKAQEKVKKNPKKYILKGLYSSDRLAVYISPKSKKQ